MTNESPKETGLRHIFSMLISYSQSSRVPKAPKDTRSACGDQIRFLLVSPGVKWRLVLADNMGVSGERMRPRHLTCDRRFRGTTLVELVVALTALAIVVLGHSFTEYRARLDVRRSARQSTAATTALLFAESWAGAEGATTYDPVADLGPQLTITAGTGPSAPTGFTSRGSYCVAIDGAYYYVTLSSQELDPTLWALNVAIAWSDQGEADPPVFHWDFHLTTYVLPG